MPLATPIILAAGTCGVLDEMAGVIDLRRVGAVVTKSITPLAREGNPTWRILPAGPGAMLNAIGLANPGLDAFIGEHLARVPAMACRVIVSVAGFCVDDYVRCVGALDRAVHELAGSNLQMVELNVSCPNVKTGTEFGHSAALITELLGAVRPAATRLKLIVKLSPATPHLVDVARAACLAGADALTLGNTYPAMAIDVETRRPRLANVTGGLSGPAVHAIALKHVHDVFSKVTGPRATGGGTGTPIVGLGGVVHWQDAAEFVLAGAGAVQVGTGLFADPRCPHSIARGLAKWVRRQKVPGVQDLVGAVAV